ncbi:ubiquitin specific protease 10 [Rhynchophorus ferrugineus]|uniref:ubiquitinyl hydrolase 1 n=1 Tax=Rhynchophorus ferrugineus TaxID=354439 RepID=A0A834MAR2_RHYFE|nr:hypothetical protein GWI33_016014 [Rhynchophorus ferrugineus]
MEFSDTLGLEFLDFSGVDEFEKNRVLASLQPSHSNSKFPWIIGDKKKIVKDSRFLKLKNKPSKQTEYVQEMSLPIYSSGNGLSTSNQTGNNPVDNRYYAPVPAYQAQAIAHKMPMPIHQNYVNPSIPNANNPNIGPQALCPRYIAPNYPIKSPVYIAVPAGAPMIVTYSNHVTYSNNNNNAYYQNTSPQYVPPETKVDQITYSNYVECPKINHDPLDGTANNLSDQTSTELRDVSESSPSINAPVTSTPAKNESVENKPKTANVWGGGKSWASLFTPKEGTVHNHQVNGITKATTEAVNKENNEALCPIKNPKRNDFVDPDCYRMGEFLSSYTLDGRTISLQPRGLINQSNYCYINSILQALIACPPMYNLLSGLSQNITSNEKRKPTPVIDGMCKFVNEFKLLPANMRVSNRRSDGATKKDQKKDQGMLVNTDIPFEPSWIYKMLNGIQTDLIEGRQEDAEEFLGCLLNNLNDEMLELIKLVENDEDDIEYEHNVIGGDEESWQTMGAKNKGSILRRMLFKRTPITDIFGGSLKSRIHRTGDHSTENTQPFLTLQLNIEKVKTVREALEALTSKYQLEGLTSSKTNQEVEAWQQVMLDELPVVLVLHLKCFDFKLDGCTKIIKALEFPIDLKIDMKLLSSKTTNAKEKQYKLFAVVYHDGKEATKGHYVTDAFHVGYSSWLRYDDASVKQVQEEQVLNPQGTRVPYLLFYRRSDTIRSR